MKERTLFGKYYDALSELGWKDRSGGLDYDHFYYREYDYIIRLVDKDNHIVLRKIRGHESNEIVEKSFVTHLPPEYILERFLEGNSVSK